MSAVPAQKAANIQDIRDALEALANLTIAHEASLDQVSRLEADRTEARNRIEELEEEAKEHQKYEAEKERDLARLRDRLAAKDETIGGLTDQIDELKEVITGEVRELACVRRLAKSGKGAEAAAEVERVLDRADPCWRQLA